ncbi:MAG: hypothetical protein Q9170_006136 [Blastenia crenularia]
MAKQNFGKALDNLETLLDIEAKLQLPQNRSISIEDDIDRLVCYRMNVMVKAGVQSTSNLTLKDLERVIDVHSRLDMRHARETNDSNGEDTLAERLSCLIGSVASSLMEKMEDSVCKTSKNLVGQTPMHRSGPIFTDWGRLQQYQLKPDEGNPDRSQHPTKSSSKLIKKTLVTAFVNIANRTFPQKGRLIATRKKEREGAQPCLHHLQKSAFHEEAARSSSESSSKLIKESLATATVIAESWHGFCPNCELYLETRDALKEHDKKGHGEKECDEKEHDKKEHGKEHGKREHEKREHEKKEHNHVCGTCSERNSMIRSTTMFAELAVNHSSGTGSLNTTNMMLSTVSVLGATCHSRRKRLHWQKAIFERSQGQQQLQARLIPESSERRLDLLRNRRIKGQLHDTGNTGSSPTRYRPLLLPAL